MIRTVLPSGIDNTSNRALPESTFMVVLAKLIRNAWKSNEIGFLLPSGFLARMPREQFGRGKAVDCGDSGASHGYWGVALVV